MRACFLERHSRSGDVFLPVGQECCLFRDCFFLSFLLGFPESVLTFNEKEGRYHSSGYCDSALDDKDKSPPVAELAIPYVDER